MRRFFFGLGVVATFAIVLLLCSLAYVAYRGSNLDHESKDYVDEAVVAIATHWDAGQLAQRASPQFLQATRPEELRSLFAALAKLGPLASYEGSTGQATMTANVGGTGGVTALYVARAIFEQGQASIQVGLVKLDGVWKVQSFRVDSPAFVNVLNSRP